MRPKLLKRLVHLEAKNGCGDCVLHFSNGTSRNISIQSRHRLSIFAEAHSLAWFYLPPDPGEEAKTIDPLAHEQAIRLIGKAERIDTSSKILRLAWSQCVRALKNERESLSAKNAPTVHAVK